MPLLEAKGVSKHFGEFRALQDVSLTVNENEFVSWSARTAPARPPSSTC